MSSKDLLQAVADGRVIRLGEDYAAPYEMDGQGVERMQLAWLARKRLIDMPLSGPPKITEDGLTSLRGRT